MVSVTGTLYLHGDNLYGRSECGVFVMCTETPPAHLRREMIFQEGDRSACTLTIVVCTSSGDVPEGLVGRPWYNFWDGAGPELHPTLRYWKRSHRIVLEQVCKPPGVQLVRVSNTSAYASTIAELVRTATPAVEIRTTRARGRSRTQHVFAGGRCIGRVNRAESPLKDGPCTLLMAAEPLSLPYGAKTPPIVKVLAVADGF